MSASVGISGELIQIWVPASASGNLFARETREGGAAFAKTQTQEPYSATVTITGPASRSERSLPLLNATFPKVQTLPGGGIFLVAPRCLRHEDGPPEMNAHIFGLDGSVREFCLGDGIQHVQTDSLGRIWVGYFDEGVYGNFGWGIPEGPQPLGAAGLVCFDQTGKATWEFAPPNGMDYISDCYALNVAEDCVWASYYTDFPIIRVDAQGKVDAWRTDLAGTRQLAISDASVLAFGGYREHRTDCYLLSLGVESAEIVADVRLLFPESVEFQKALVIGRGRFLYVVEHDTLFTFEVPSAS